MCKGRTTYIFWRKREGKRKKRKEEGRKREERGEWEWKRMSELVKRMTWFWPFVFKFIFPLSYFNTFSCKELSALSVVVGIFCSRITELLFLQLYFIFTFASANTYFVSYLPTSCICKNNKEKNGQSKIVRNKKGKKGNNVLFPTDSCNCVWPEKLL